MSDQVRSDSVGDIPVFVDLKISFYAESEYSLTREAA